MRQSTTTSTRRRKAGKCLPTADVATRRRTRAATFAARLKHPRQASAYFPRAWDGLEALRAQVRRVAWTEEAHPPSPPCPSGRDASNVLGLVRVVDRLARTRVREPRR